LIADINGRLERADPVFALTHGLTAGDRSNLVNPIRYGARSWYEKQQFRFAISHRHQAAAIVAYLRLKFEHRDFDRGVITPALNNFWLERAEIESPRSS